MNFTDNLFKDVQYGLRMLTRYPAFTAIAILTIALGIGANTAIFSVVDAVLLRPLPFHDPDRVCLITESIPSLPSIGPSYENFVDFRNQASSFENMSAVRISPVTLTGTGEPMRLQAQFANASLFPLLGVRAIQGHTFTADEDRFGGPQVALLSYSFWQSHFGGTGDVLGKSITVDDQPYKISGILPRGFQFVQPADVILPFEPWAHTLPDDRNWHPGIIAVGRLKTGVTLTQARAEMSTIAKRLEKQYPLYDHGMGANVNPLHDRIVNNVRPALEILFGAVALVLLIACSNIASLLLARGTARTREIALRRALGAERARILRQLLVESLLLASLGGALGIFCAWAAINPLLALAKTSLPNVGPIGIDAHVLAFTAGLIIAAGILFGLAPGWQVTKIDVQSVVSGSSRGTTAGARQLRLRNVLVIAEIALALPLLLSAGLLIRSFNHLQRVQTGFTPSNLLVADVPLSPNKYAKSEQRMQFFDRLLSEARLLPGVRSAGAAVSLPVSSAGFLIHFNITGRPPKGPGDFLATGYRPVSPGYLQTLRVPLLQGRLLTDADTERSPFVAVVNQAMANQFFPGEPALGRSVQLGATPEKDVPTMRIVGVVGNIKDNLTADSQPQMYVPLREGDTLLPITAVSLVMRTENDPHTEILALRNLVKRLDPTQPLVNVRTMEDNIATAVSAPRFRTVLLGIFAVSALLLAVIGIYGLMAYAVNQRVQEIGVRMALGAAQRDVLRLVIGQGFRLLLIGVGAGMVIAVGLRNLLASFLFGVSATDAATFVDVGLILVVVGLVASYIPARRAMRVDPITALRYE